MRSSAWVVTDPNPSRLDHDEASKEPFSDVFDGSHDGWAKV